MNARTLAAVLAVALAVVSGCGTSEGASSATRSSSSSSSSSAARPSTAHPSVAGPSGLPTPDHVMVVIFENEDAQKIVGGREAPYLTSLAKAGANFTDAHGEGHPSEPNYLALFSGSTQGVTDDSCPLTLSGPTLASGLAAAGHTFVGYSEDLPSAGFTGCRAGGYARKHNPWANFADLPTVSFVVPNLCNDMHDCGVAAGDRWASQHLPAYLDWAKQHNSLLVVTFDEDNGSAANHIATVLVGPMVTAGTYDQRIDHYGLLRTLEDMYGLPHLGHAADAAPLTGLWRTTPG